MTKSRPVWGGMYVCKHALWSKHDAHALSMGWLVGELEKTRIKYAVEANYIDA